MHDETPSDLGRILSFAATYMEEHGRARFSFGRTSGRPLCPVAAIAVGLGYRPRDVGRGCVFRCGTEALRAVGTIILRTGLLDQLPVPARPYGRRKLRPLNLSPLQAAHELAKWSDDKTLDTIVIGALRARASELADRWSHKSLVTTATL